MASFRRAGPRLEFEDVTPDRPRCPSWVVKHGRGAVVTMPRPVDLRPANLPHDLAALEDVVAKEDTPPPPPAAPVPVASPAVPEPLAPEPPREVVRYEIDEQATQELRVAVSELIAAREAVMRETEHEAVKLAEVIARKVIARELALDPSIVEGLVREGMGALAQSDRLTVRVGLGFAAATNDLMSAFAHEAPDLRVVVDDQLGLYGCVVDAQLGRVDESIETRLSTLLATLVGEAEGRGNPGHDR